MQISSKFLNNLIWLEYDTFGQELKVEKIMQISDLGTIKLILRNSCVILLEY